MALLLVGLALSGVPTVPAHATATGPREHVIADADTAIRIEAGAASPRLASLSLQGRTTWINAADDPLPASVEIDGIEQRPVWRLDAAASRFVPQAVELVYLADSPRLRLVWSWRARAPRGPLEHAITIENLGAAPVWLPLVPSLRFDWQIDAGTALRRFWVEKGADTPSSQGVHDDPFGEADRWAGMSSTYARPLPGQPREMIPYVLVHEQDAERRGWYLGLEFSGRTHITLERNGHSVRGEAGLNPEPGPYRTRLLPREVFAAPTIFLGAATGGADGAGNALRRWVRAVLNNPRTLQDPAYPLLVSNSWGSGMAVDATLARRMIVEARGLGLEMFHLDAGWFRAVGDWEPDPAKFPDGVAPIADFAHQQNLRFGLWIDWTQAGTSTHAGALNVDDPVARGWLIADPPAGWKHAEEFKGITIDLGVPAAQAWAAARLERIVRDNHIDMLEHDGYLVAQGTSRADHPAAPPAAGTLREYEDSGFVWADSSNSTDVSYRATRAYYAIHEELRRRHPRLLFELCNDGGRMVDFGSAAHGDYFSITDTYDPLSNRRAFYDASFVLPPAMLETYVEQWPAPSLDNLRYMLRSGMQGWFSLMLDSSRWTAAEHAAARAEFALYKRSLRPLIRAADLYHVGDRPDGVHWDGIEYFSARGGKGVLYAFRGTGAGETTHRFVLQGLDRRRRYRLHFQDQGAAADRIETGESLLTGGLEVRLDAPLSSELIFIAADP